MSVEPDAETPWYRRGSTLLISAGTVAAALVSVFTLGGLLFNAKPVALATINSVTTTARTALTAFAAEDLGQGVTLNRMPNAASRQIWDNSLARAQVDAATIVLLKNQAQFKSSITPKPTVSPSPIPEATTTTATPPSSSPATPPSSSPATTSGSASSTASPATGTSTPTPSSAPTTKWVPGVPPDEYRNELKQQLVMTGLPPDVSDDWVVYSTQSRPVDATGQLLPPAQVALELKKALDEVVTVGGETPMGWTVLVAVELEGLANVPLLLTWSLDGIDVSETWQTENLAYEISASTQHDAGVAKIWIPDLERTGQYKVNVRLAYKDSAVTAAAGQADIPGH